MKYTIKEIFFTLQGEGYNTGKPAIFCRFAGCNLWNGKEKDRTSAKCSFCDTDFVGTDGENGGKYNKDKLVEIIVNLWPKKKLQKFIVFTGGEPLLQLNKELIDSLKQNNFKIAVETNGTLLPPKGLDWICVSPKANADIVLKSGNELKVIYPQEGLDLVELEKYKFDNFYLQPLYNDKLKSNTKKTIDYVMNNTKWKLSIQMHKFLGLK